MNNNNLSKFNNEYLKCIVTTHSCMIDTLKDKGALIIYQSNNDGSIRNHIYLGNQFLASGYGFKSKEDLESAANIVKNYGNQHDEINKKLNNINEILSSINDNVNETLQDFKSNVDYTITDAKDNEISLKEIIFHGAPAIYEDFEVYSIKIKLTYFDGEYDDPALKKYKVLDISNIDVIDLPIGSKIISINYSILYNKHDSAGISGLNVIYYSSTDNYKHETPEIFSYEESQFNLTTEVGEFHFDLMFNDGFIVTSEEKIPLIDSIQINVKETPESKYKEYPKFVNNEHNCVYSLENMILEHSKVILNSIYVRGISYMAYLFGKYTILDNQNNNDTNITNVYSLSNIKNKLENSTLNQLKDENNNVIIKKGIKYINNVKTGGITDIYIDVDSLNFNVFNLFIGTSFSLHFVEYITLTSEYNWTGATGIYNIIDDENISEYTPIIITYNGLSSLKTKLYQIKILDENKPMTNIGQLHLQILCTTDNFVENDIINNVDNISNNIDEPIVWNLLNNDKFNQTHWLTYNDINDIDMLKTKLNVIKTNY